MLIFISLSFLICPVFSEPNPPISGGFELKSGDRVVFLGNSLFENEQRYSYLELALSSRWPDREISFRNLGWSGDTVFGDARSYYTSPPSAYELMLDQLTKAKPTVVFLAYGAIEALEGKKSIGEFTDGLNKLLEAINEVGATTILLSPIPQFTTGDTGELAGQNQDLETYSEAMAKVASERDYMFINIYHPLQALGNSVTDNGFHLNETGYYHLTAIIEDALGLSRENWSIDINLTENRLDATLETKIVDWGTKNGDLKIEIKENLLPLPLPENFTEINHPRIMKIKGLSKGFYSLNIDGKQVASASAKDWANGVILQEGGAMEQSKELRSWIFKKDEIFFRQYRPLNRTYIIGFRSYEQGRHMKDLEDLDIILVWLEGQIHDAKRPKPNIYHLSAIQ